GVAQVESTASTAPALCAIFATAAKSVIDHSGLAGVSAQMSLVEPGRTEARTASTSLISTRSTFKPHQTASLISQLRSDQYMTFGAMTWSPGESARNTAVAADIPEPNTTAAFAPSRAAISLSASRTVSLSGRPYTLPLRYWLSSSRM